MERNFYWVNIADVPQWYITTPVPASGGAFAEPWMFGEGHPLPDPGPSKARIRNPGQKRALVFAGVERTPIGSGAVANVFRTQAPNDVQLFPITIEGEPEQYFIINATKTVDCIDEAKCRQVQHYAEDDPFPEYAGEYRWIHGLRIDPSKTGDAHVLRPRKFKTALIVSEEVKAALEQVGNLGVHFERVTGPQSAP
ncbi:imm11 family protein [Corallococcus coralloides]|uniref:imm11 family protein n=1 Tax=Corallococcus coralloides TaxID=184914 RepID=UPI003850A8DD